MMHMDMAGTPMDIWNLMSQMVLIPASVVAYVFTWTSGKDSRRLNGLSRNNIKWSVILVVVFTILTFARIIIPNLIVGNGLQPLIEALSEPMVLMTLLVLPVNFFMTWIAFFGYAYMKTNNIWVPVIMHYINNNLGVLLNGGTAQDQLVAWSDLPLLLVALLPMIIFILMPIFNKKSDCTVQER